MFGKANFKQKTPTNHQPYSKYTNDRRSIKFKNPQQDGILSNLKLCTENSGLNIIIYKWICLETKKKCVITVFCKVIYCVSVYSSFFVFCIVI